MSACPSVIQLHRWLAGDLSDAESHAIEAHVKSCTNICQPLIDSFSGFEEDSDAAVPLAVDKRMVARAVAADPGEQRALQAAGLPNLPGYDILGQLGRGGMGVVYKARHRRMDRSVAIKVLPPSVIDDAAAVARFEREVRASARLHHPNIVAAYDAAEAGGMHFLVMEYVAGTNLAALVRQQGPLAVEQAVEWVLQAARGLDYAHRHGVVHRDIKPSNLLVDREGVVKVLDMGLARFESSLGGEQTDLTSMGQIMGTVDYMAPEQALDTHHADARSDIYSLGMTLWYLLAGRPAYAGDNALARVLAHREQPIPSLRAACPAATPELEAIFRKMVAKQPTDRYQTMAEVIAALEDGLPRPSSISTGTAQEPGVGAAHHESGGGHCPRHVAIQTAPPKLTDAPDMEATLTLDMAEVDTDPNTEQSLDKLASALPCPPRRSFRVAAALTGLAAIAVAAAFVVRVQTDRGEVVIESEVDGISVDILRNGETIKDDWQIHSGADNRWAVRSGTVIVRLPAGLDGEFNLDQDSAHLIRDGKILVKITRKKKPKDTALATKDRDRAAAQWVLDQNGVATCLDRSGAVVVATSPTMLPAEKFQLYGASLSGAHRLVGADLARFAELPKLSFLELEGTNVDSKAIPWLVKIPNLGTLDVRDTRLKSSELAGLVPARKLWWLSLSAEQNDDGYRGIAQLGSVRQLTIYHASANDILQLAEARQLRTIWLPDATTADDQAVAQLRAAQPLCRVFVAPEGEIRLIGSDPIGEAARRLRAKGVEMEIVSFPPHEAARSVTNDADIAAGKAFSIAALTIPTNVSLSDDEIGWLRCFDHPFYFWGEGVVRADRYAAALTNQLLSGVELANSDLTDAGLKRFEASHTLEYVDARSTKVTREGVESLQKALPDCRIVWQPRDVPASAP